MAAPASNQGEPLDRVAKVIRSKNAGPFEITFDVMFDDAAAYDRVKRSGVIDAMRIAGLYRIPPEDVLVCKPFDAALAFKITIRRPVSSGDWMDTDVYGCQQHVPLTAIMVPRYLNSEPAAPELEIRGLRKLYGDYCAVDDLSLSVASGEFITILGASGSGKTTTLMMIAGFDYPTAGDILFRNRTITYMPPHLRNIGMVFQSYALFPHLSVFDNIAFPLKLRRVGRAEIRARVDAALDLVRLGEHARKRPAQLSGGQQQRIALARALVFGPSLLLMDEPLGALDKALREQMQLEIKRVQAATGVTILSVTHDQDEALAMSDRIVVMDKGRVEVVGTPLALYERPPNQMVAEFLKETNILRGEISADGGRIRVQGGMEIRSTHASAGTARRGAAVTCCLRPECIRLSADGAAARIRAKIYLGDIVKFHVVIAGTEIELVIKALASGDTRKLQPGDAVRIAWSDDDVQILTHH